MSNTQSHAKIGEVTKQLGISADTLRYYEKIGLLPAISRTPAGIRLYDQHNLSQLRFIQRAKSMNFSLDEIGKLLEMRANPQQAQQDVRELTHRKLTEVEQQLKNLDTLRRELTLLVNLCQGSAAGCPIIEGLDQQPPKSKQGKPL